MEQNIFNINIIFNGTQQELMNELNNIDSISKFEIILKEFVKNIEE